MSARESIGERLKRERVERGMSQRGLAARVGVGHPYISKIEAGRDTPSDALLERIAEVFEMPDPDDGLVVCGVRS
jgi:transcriptional regulator with XRE-family HTH domain